MSGETAWDRGPVERLRHIILVPFFYATEWLLAAAAAALFASLRYQGMSVAGIFLVFWALNMAISAAFVLCNDRLRVDMTLMQNLQLLIARVQRRAPWPGLALEVVVFIRLLIWDGPCQCLIFFRHRLSTRMAKTVFFIAASALQMWIWTHLYALGYEGATELAGHLWESLA